MRRVSRRHLVQGAGALGLGLLAGCGRWPGQAQPLSKTPRIGFLALVAQPFHDAFGDGLRDLGYVEGRNIIVERRFADGVQDRLPALAAELVRLSVDVLVTAGTPATQAAKDTTSVISIVMVAVTDPVRRGLVASFARPGGNVTGAAGTGWDLNGKQLQLLQDAVPKVARVSVLRNPAAPDGALIWNETAKAAGTLGIQLRSLEVTHPTEFAAAFEAGGRGHADALYLLDTPLLLAHRTLIVEFASSNDLPAMYPRREFVDDGGLMAYGVNFAQQFRSAAAYVDKILKGAKPADLPVEQPMRFDFVINLKTAQALGLTIPPHVLLQATEVIQ
jgi:putative tryptophan/tyrosine transport system substrate-binding protein